MTAKHLLATTQEAAAERWRIFREASAAFNPAIRRQHILHSSLPSGCIS
jgi:hypothetical protein